NPRSARRWNASWRQQSGGTKATWSTSCNPNLCTSPNSRAVKSICSSTTNSWWRRTMALDVIRTYCKALRLPTVAQVLEDALATAQREDWSPQTFLYHLLEQEMAGRHERRISRLIKAAHLPPGKTLESFDQQRLPLRVRRQIPQLCEGEFIDRTENILVF